VVTESFWTHCGCVEGADFRVTRTLGLDTIPPELAKLRGENSRTADLAQRI
jgi:hypothetical protein